MSQVKQHLCRDIVKTVDKAMKLLNLFSIERSEMGLSELAGNAGFDKATTRRLLVSLAKHNFIDQNQISRKYRLGSGFVRLAHIREMTTPIGRVSQETTDWLTDETGETAHISIPEGNMLITIALSEPNRGTIVHLDKSERLPLNATASGIVFLGFLSRDERSSVLSQPQSTYTPHTITDPGVINDLAERAYRNGYGTIENGFEVDVSGIATPYFGQGSAVEGTIAVATPSARMDEQKRQHIVALLFEASGRLTRTLGGEMHPQIDKIKRL